MTDKHNTSLSPFQSAILNELGISQWQLSGDSSVSLVADGQNPIAAMEGGASATAEVEQLAIPEQVLLLMSSQEANEPVVKDILLSLSLAQHKQVLASTDALNSFSDYPLAWIVSQDKQQGKIHWQNNCLTTPAIGLLHQSDIKKQLWAVIQHINDSSVS